jgi:hypothetical protein
VDFTAQVRTKEFERSQWNWNGGAKPGTASPGRFCH